MKILYAASEAAPYAKSGGLGDVMGSLPMASSKIKGNEVCVVLPYYNFIKHSDLNAEYVGRIYVPLAWRHTYAGVFKKVIKNKGVGINKRNDLIYYFIDNDYYFDRASMYGEADDGERFAFFSKAVLECLNLIDFFPDIIHANDWQTGFIPLFLKAHYSHIECYARIRTVFTIHNIEYQGKADPLFLTEVLGADEIWRNTCTFDGLINAMKTGIVLCDRLTTVSETYSHEVMFPYFAHSLHDILRENSYKMHGIVNGIDTAVYNPRTNALHPYSASDTSGKDMCKKALRERLGLNPDSDAPIVAVVSRLVNHKGLELIKGVIHEMANLDLQLVVLGTGDKEYEDMFKFMAYSYPDKVSASILFDSALSRDIYAGADFLLMPSKSEPCGLSQLIAMRYGTIPIVRETGGLVDTVPPINPQELTGRGITFKVFNAHDMLHAVMRACELYRDKDKFSKIRSSVMRFDSGWKISAQKYMDVYNLLKD